ncbi:MAG: hypothetical protein H0W64_02545 [Gammaproteobacteria bacterium]|nr:hypothetical protein [Gammaproteobacteria bacterium]
MVIVQAMETVVIVQVLAELVMAVVTVQAAVTHQQPVLGIVALNLQQIFQQTINQLTIVILKTQPICGVLTDVIVSLLIL